MRLSTWLAPLTAPRPRLADKVVRKKATRRRTANRLSQMTERLEARTLLTSFTVDTFFDTVDDNPGDGSALDATGQTSLRAAIMEANASAGPNTINLGGGIFSLSIEGRDEDAALTGDLDITDDLIITGQSPLTTIIDASSLDRVFDVFPGVTLQLSDVTISGGDLADFGDGGGIRVDGGTLQIFDSVITGNRATNGGGIFSNNSTVTINGSTLSQNRAESGQGGGEGGAVSSFGGNVIVQRSSVHDNFAQTVGGGFAAGADTQGGTLSIENSTIAQNNAGDAQVGSGDGGGFFIQPNVNASLLAATVAFNSAGNQGAGIWTNGSLTLERTIISNNVGTPDDGPEGFISGGTVTSNGFNLIRENTDFNFTPGTGDLIGTFPAPIDPNLLGLADNGGPANSASTLTIALGPMSPAIDAGPSFASPLFEDQRGFDRERDGDRNGSIFTDIGAFELQSPSDYFVDDIGTGVIMSGFAGDFQVVMDGDGVTGGGGGTPNGILDFGDIVTFNPGGQPVFNLEFGVRAFGSINNALSVARSSEDSQNEIVIGSGVYNENLTLDSSGLILRGHSGLPSDVVINGGGAASAISVTETRVSLESLRVTNASVGVDVNIPSFTSGKPFFASNIQIDNTSTAGLRVFGPTSDTSVFVRDSTITGNTGDGINIRNVRSTQLRNVSATMNGQDGVDIANSPIVALDIVTVDQNSDRGLAIDNADTIAVMDPRTSASANGNAFSNLSVLFFNGVAGNVKNSTTITDTQIQFDAGAGATQEPISLTNVTTLFVTGDGGNDTLTVDYSTGNPPAGRQLFLSGGPGADTIASAGDQNLRVSDAQLTIGGIDEVAITSFEQASLTGGAGNNNLDASEFDGQATLSGLSGNDTLRGSSNDDVLDGGADDDILRSGPSHEQYTVGDTTFENLNLVDSDTGVVTILDETDTDFASILLDSDFFRFNDVSYAGNTLFVAPSGVVSFGGPISPQNNFDLNAAPNPSIGILAPLFDDWVTGITSPPGLTLPDAKVLYKFEDLNADLINDRLIVEWNDVYHRDQIDTLSTPFIKAGASPVTFQLILELNTFDRDGDITFNYVDLDTGAPFSAIADGLSATVGGKDGGENPSGIEQVSFNSSNPLIGSNEAILARSAASDGDDILTGGAGDDLLFSSSGIDSIDGGGGTNDRLIFSGFDSDLASNHTINNLAVESQVFLAPLRTVDFKTSYSNIEALDVGFGPADQNVLVELNGLPALVSLDTSEPTASDSVTIQGTSGDDTLTLVGTTLSNGTTTVDLSGVENLTLDISSGGADSISVDQTFTSSARSIVVTGDSSDDAVSLQSTTKKQQVNIFSVEGFITQIQEVIGGDIVLEEVLNDGGDDGSGNTIGNQQAPDQVIVSPDGTRVYVAASDSDALVVYSRDRVTGDLTFVESLKNTQMDSFGNTISGLDGASNVIVSADGRYVYVASEVDQTIALFVHHEGDDQLTFITSTVFDVGGNPVSVPLPSDMAFIPDGRVLLVTSESANRVDFFEVSENGDLTFQASLVDGGFDSGMNTIDGLGGASSVALSPDGRYMYVAGGTDNAIAVFGEPGQGPEMDGFVLPLFVEKLANGDMDGALNIVSGLGGASSVEVSPDGRHVYATGETENSIAVFSRDSNTGQLTFVERLVNGGLDSMSNTVKNLLAPASVSVSPEGTTVYVAASGSNAVTLFARDFGTGALTFLETLESGQPDGAGTTVAGVTNVSSVFASRDGQHVYASGTGDDAIVRFNVPRLLDVSTDGSADVSITTSDADDSFMLRTFGQPDTLTIDSGGSIDNDTVAIQGTSSDDTIGVNGGTVTFGDTTLTLTNTEALSLFTDDGNDTVNVTASPTGPVFFSADGGSQTSTDVLNVDAQAEQAVDGGSNISFSGGLQAVNYSAFESVAITNAAPIVDDDTFSVLEDAAVGTSVGTPNGSDPEAGESLTWSIQSGNVGGAFAINASTGEITVNSTLDFEVRSSYTLVVQVEDQQMLTDTATITISVTDVEPMVGDQSFDVLENQPDGTSVGTVALSPGDLNSVAFSITAGNTGTAFAINSTTGLITIANTAAIDFETGSPFSLTVQVTDDGGTTTDTGIVTVNILDSNEPPMIVAQSFNVDENSAVATSVGTVLATDFETPSGLTFAITAGDSLGQFAINPSTGEITVAKIGLDHESNGSFNLTVQVTDPGSLSSSAPVVINVDDVNEAPVLVPIGNKLATVDEELAFTALADDPDSPPAPLTFGLGAGAPTGASITSSGDFTFTPTSAQDGMTFPVTIIVTEDGRDGLADSETITITVSSEALDFGDAPASFGTLLADDGPRHVIGSLFLGNAVDPEADGQPDIAALGDDNNSTGPFGIVDDEDGITFLSALGVGTTRQFRVFASEAGFLDAWIDYDQSGDFSIGENLSSSSLVIPEGGGASSGGESFNVGGGSISGSFNVGTGIAVPAGFSTVSFDIPNTAVPGATIARFRLSSTGGLSPGGLASDGEVEDYVIGIAAPPEGNSDSIEPALDTAVDGFFNAFPDELNDPDPNIQGNELPLAVQAENGARAERRDGAPPLNQTDPALRTVIRAINDAVQRLEQDRGVDENILVVATHPVDFLLTDTQGRTVGFTQDAGNVNEIGADATFTGDGVVELLTIRNADPGEYGLQLVGVGGVFRGGASLITPAGTQEITFEGSLAQNDDVELALTYQEDLFRFPTEDDIDFSEIADLVAQIPTADDEAKTLAAAATEALASIELDRLDASLFSKKDDEQLALEELLERISKARKKLLDAIKTSLDDDELESLKSIFGDEGEDAESVEALARVLLETLSGPLISAPRQVKELSGTLQQLLDQLQEQKEKQQKQQGNPPPANSKEPKGATKPEADDKRISQRSPDRPTPTVVNSAYVVNSSEVARRRNVEQVAASEKQASSESATQTE